MVGLQKPDCVIVSSNRCLLKFLGTQPPFISMANQYLSSPANFIIGESPTHHCTLIYSKRSVRPASTPSRSISTGYLKPSIHMDLSLTELCSGIPLAKPKHFRFRDRSPRPPACIRCREEGWTMGNCTAWAVSSCRDHGGRIPWVFPGFYCIEQIRC